MTTSALLEMDFLGNQPTTASEASFFQSPTMRIRHAAFRVESPVVDVLVGQYWNLFGWQEDYLPNSVEIQGLPGELYARTPQVRVSKAIRGDGVTFEAAVGAMRPPSKDSQVPEVVGGVRVAANHWLGVHTAGSTATALTPASIAVTGDYRHFAVPDASTLVPSTSNSLDTGSVAANAFVPILVASPGRLDNSLSLMGQFVYGSAIADLYSNLSGSSSGVVFPAIPNTSGLNPAPTWPVTVDQGLVNYTINTSGMTSIGSLQAIRWTTYVASLEYTLPGLGGRAWISGNYSHSESPDAATFARTGSTNPLKFYFQTSTAQVRQSEDFFDVNFFFDPWRPIRVGLEFAAFYDHYVDGVTSLDYRGQASGFFLF